MIVKKKKYIIAPGAQKSTCIFPFKDYKDPRLHTKCKTTKRTNMEWCATKLKPSGLKDKWGYCIPNNMTQDEYEKHIETLKHTNQTPPSVKFKIKKLSKKHSEQVNNSVNNVSNRPSNHANNPVNNVSNKLYQSGDCIEFGKDPCNSLIGLNVFKNAIQKKITNAKKCCDDNNPVYKDMASYFKQDKPATLKDLLKVLQKYYIKQKKDDINYLLSFREFVNMFPRDTSLKGQNFKKQYVFEAICRILLVLEYDKHNGTPHYGKKKEFYKSLESYLPSKKNIESKEQILTSKINESSSAGVVDIFFKVSSKDFPKETNKFACEGKLDCDGDKTPTEKEDLFILIQNKYYDNESSNISKYDAPKMYRRAQKILDPKKGIDKFKIVLMVNNENILDSKLKEFDKYGIEIIGIDRINIWFQQLLIDLYTEPDLDKFLDPSFSRITNTIQPRFHQNIFIDTTIKHIDDGLKKFIWGAVPRSGKSYIIGGLCSQRSKNTKTNNNDIIIILGAKTETQGQFKDIFDFKGKTSHQFSDFKDYGYIGPGEKETSENTKDKNIYVMSQEFLKWKDIKKGKGVEEQLKKFKSLISKKKIDLYFDEIHKGGSTDNSKDILEFFIDYGFSIDIFVMVTATFAKPTIMYENFLEDDSPIVIQWSYEDQQLMKGVNTNPINLDIVKGNHSSKYELESIDKNLEDYNIKYGEDYLRILAEEYHKHPELVLINPETMDDYFSETNLAEDLFKLKCSAIDYTNSKNLLEPSQIFENKSHFETIITKIGNYNESVEDINTLYGQLKYKYNNDLVQNHLTQLWFLPVSDLYNDPDCQIKGASYKPDQEEGDVQPDEDSSKKKKEGRPHIEPLFRGVALLLMENIFFKQHFNVLIVHNNGNLFNLTKLKNESVNCTCDDTDSRLKKLNLVDRIKHYECEAKKNNKGLIILTGSKLRLGVSLPCADIAFNFDNITSIDSNYQTMFRVLTERPGKEYGYYVDFNKGRCINFIYEYNQIYSSNMKKSKTMEELNENVQNILHLFNFNLINFQKQDVKTMVSLYSKLNSDLHLDSANFKDKYLTDFGKNFSKTLLKVSDITKLKELNKLLGHTLGETSKIKKVIKKGTKKKPPPTVKTTQEHNENIEGNEDNVDKRNEEEEDDMSDNEIIKNMRILIPTIVFLLAFFNDEINYNCSTLEECLNNSIEKIDKFHDTLCNCDDILKDNQHPIACYLKKIKEDFSTKIKLKTFLEKLKSIFFSDDTIYIEQRNQLIIYFDNIKDSFKKKEDFKKKKKFKIKFN